MDSDYCRGADLCDEIAGKSDVLFNRTYQGNPPSRQIATTPDFVVMVDFSPLTLGHLLLLPRRHYFSFAQVIAARPSALEEVLSWLLPTYDRTFGKAVILEHGSAEGMDHGACISHAHWHLVPLNGDLVSDLMVRDGLEPMDLLSLHDLGRQPWRDSPYFFQSFSTRHRVYEPLDNMRRQYIRSAVGRILLMEDPEWDYSVVVRRELLRSTMRLASQWNVPSDDV